MFPDWLDRAVWRCVDAVKKLRKRGTLVERISGTRGNSSKPIDVLVTGRTTTVDYLLKRLIKNNVEYAERRRVSDKALGSVLNDYADADLAMIRKNSKAKNTASNQWRVPDAVASIIDLDSNAKGPRPGYENIDSLRRIKKYGLTASVSHDRQELSDFIQTAYIPHIRSRFGDLARPHSGLVITRAFNSGGLLWVQQDGVRLAGLVFSVAGDTVNSRVAAPVSDSELASKAHAVSSTKKFLIDYAVERGYKRLHLGNSRPHLLDGVLRHKKRWGARLVDSSASTEFQLSWRAFTPAIAQWLCTTPLVVRDSGSLAGLTALAEDESLEACEHRLRRLWSPGLVRIIVLSEAKQDLGIDEVCGTRVTWCAAR
jgi:hypothetical protein